MTLMIMLIYTMSPPPETDDQAKRLATQIKKWIQDGRPKS